MWCATENIVWRENNGMYVLLNVSSGHYYTVNETGSQLWKHLVDDHMSLDEAIEQLGARFNSLPDQQTLRADCTEMLEQWKSEGLIQEKP